MAKKKGAAKEEESLKEENFEQWNSEELASYLKTKAGLGDYYEMLIQHNITGEVAPRLTEKDMAEIGITNIGDRKRFGKALEDLQKQHRKQEREKVVWEGKEILFPSCWAACCQTGCGCCPVDPAQYTLTGTHLIIKLDQPCRVGPIRCCCLHEYQIDNVDLTHVTDVDVHSLTAPCCQHIFCRGKPRDKIIVKTTTDGTKVLTLKKGDGEIITRKILNQVEEAQKMERD